jgi:hypothetical protein
VNRLRPVVAVMIGVVTATIPTFLLYRAVTFLCFIPLAIGTFSIILALCALGGDSKLSRHVIWLTLALLLVAVSVPYGLIGYYNQPGYPIVLVIPDAYRGPVRLIIDGQKGVDKPLKDKKYTYIIPSSGTLVIKDSGPFHQWHSMTAAYASGQKIPIEYQDKPSKASVVLFSLGSGVTTQGGRREESIDYFLGTETEKRQYVDNRYP